MVKEKEIESGIIEFLCDCGLDPVLKINQNKSSRRVRNYEPGVPDIIGWLPDGRGFAIEVKTDTGKPSKDQINMINRINSSRGVSFISRSVWQTYQQLMAFWPEIKSFETLANQTRSKHESSKH